MKFLSNLFPGVKTFLFFVPMGVLGLVVALQGVDLKPILLPLVCQAAADAPIEGNDCVGNIVKFVGWWTTGLSGVALFLRAVTTSPLFIAWVKPE